MLHVTGKDMAMPTPIRQRVQKRRETLRAAGLRPLQIWVPDTRRSGFQEECNRQARAVAIADAADQALGSFMDSALGDIDGSDG